MQQQWRAGILVFGMVATCSLLLLNVDFAEAANFTVEDSAAVGDSDPGDGVCQSKLRPGTLLRRCTLNAAVEEANALSGSHTIFIPSGTFRFDDNDCAIGCGFMRVTGQMTIVGAGSASTIITSGLFSNGIIVQPNARLELRNLTYSGNSRIENIGGTLTVTNSVLRDNRSAFGDALSLRPDSSSNPRVTTITNSRLTGNTTFGSGASGAIFVRGGTLHIESSTIDSNVANCSNCSGAMTIGQQFVAAVVDLRNVTISGNSEGGGGAGGIGLIAGRLDLRNVTIANNSRLGLFAVCCFATTRIGLMQSTIIAGNGDKNCGGVGGSFDVSIQNLDSGTSCEFAAFEGQGGTGNLENIDPKLGPLQNNGGPTLTHGLLVGSPAIDAASCILLTDQRGVSRPQNGDNIGAALCDIGAFEKQPEIKLSLPLGIPSLSPGTSNVRVQETLTERLVWDVPAPQNWGALGTLDFRLRSDGKIAFWVRWDQHLDTLQLIDALGQPIDFAVSPGLDVPLSANGVFLDVSAARSEGSGITGQRATLVLPLRFDDRTIGRTFAIEVSAQDDEGRQDPFTQVGTINVTASGAAISGAGGAVTAGLTPEDQPNVRRLTETQKQQKERTNTLGLDDYRAEGNVVAVRANLEVPEVDIANRDGVVTLRLLNDAAKLVKDLKPGDYVDGEGQKETEQLYWIDDLSVKR